MQTRFTLCLLLGLLCLLPLLPLLPSNDEQLALQSQEPEATPRSKESVKQQQPEEPTRQSEGPSLEELDRQMSETFQQFHEARRANNFEGMLTAAEKHAETNREVLRHKELKQEVRGKIQTNLDNALRQLVFLYRQQENIPAVEKLLVERVDLQKARFGEKSHQTTDARVELDAVKTYRQLTPAQRKEFQDALRSSASVGGLHQQRRFDEALQVGQRANKVIKRLVGEGHPTYAAGLSDLAGIYNSMRDYRQAEVLLGQALAAQRKVYGDNHPQLAAGTNNLAAIYITPKGN